MPLYLPMTVSISARLPQPVQFCHFKRPSIWMDTMWSSRRQGAKVLGCPIAFERGGMTTFAPMMEDSLIGRSAIIGAIGSKLADLIVDLVQQRLHLRSITGFLICQAVRIDFTAVGINQQMQRSPATPGLCTMLFFQPLASAIDLQPRTVDQNVTWSISRSPSFGRRHPSSCPSARCRVIGLGRRRAGRLCSRRDRPHPPQHQGYQASVGQADEQPGASADADRHRQTSLSWRSSAAVDANRRASITEVAGYRMAISFTAVA